MKRKADNLISAKANLRSKLSRALSGGRSQNCEAVSVKANLHGKLSRAVRGGRSQNRDIVRFWIITMMLVLVGLSTLKLR
jgi:UDP-N-acetylmuramyl pentapeptide phosphotransferase/UDP-N-acetylglucosamine-1-phosphate transferase